MRNTVKRAGGGWDGQAIAVLLFGWFVALYVTLT
jgi:hypothetical protein